MEREPPHPTCIAQEQIIKLVRLGLLNFAASLHISYNADSYSSMDWVQTINTSKHESAIVLIQNQEI